MYYPDRCFDNVNYSELALKTNEVYLSSPSGFDDVYDSELNVSSEEFALFRLKKCCKWSGINFETHNRIDEIKDMLVNKISDEYQQDINLSSLFKTECLNTYERLESVSFALRLKLGLVSEEPSIALDRAIENEYVEFAKELKEQFRVSCFTTSPMSQLMWGGSYANEHRGFCLEYTVKDEEEYKDILYNIKPVIYTRNRRVIAQDILESFDSNWNEESLRDIYIHGVLRKSIDWAYQNEWRLILLPKSKGQLGFTQKYFPITKVYLGNRMTAERRKTIIDICKEKNIPYAGVVRSKSRFEMQECSKLCDRCLSVGSHEDIENNE